MQLGLELRQGFLRESVVRVDLDGALVFVFRLADDPASLVGLRYVVVDTGHTRRDLFGGLERSDGGVIPLLGRVSSPKVAESLVVVLIRMGRRFQFFYGLIEIG